MFEGKALDINDVFSKKLEKTSFFCIQISLDTWRLEELIMLKLKISGTKNDLKAFRKWLLRAAKILPKYQINDNPVFKQNGKDSIYYHYEADLLKPLDMEGGRGYVQSNRNNESKGWGWKNNYHN